VSIYTIFGGVVKVRSRSSYMRYNEHMLSRNFSAIHQELMKKTDLLGSPIDSGILRAVSMLCMHGINTIGSCEGHADRVTGGPYVMFAAPHAQMKFKAASELDRHSVAYARAIQKIAANNAIEIKKALQLLDGFYKKRSVPAERRLIVRSVGLAAAKILCQGAEIAHMLSESERKILLKANRAEMDAFTSYLERLLK
jgi:hypothetical protein